MHFLNFELHLNIDKVFEKYDQFGLYKFELYCFFLLFCVFYITQFDFNFLYQKTMQYTPTLIQTIALHKNGSFDLKPIIKQ